MASKLTNKEVVEWVLSCLHEAEDGRIEKENFATASWRMYFNDHDFSRKADWQTKVPVPAWAMGVDQAAGAIKQALKQANRMFTVEVLNPSDPMAVAQAKFIHDAMHELLRQAEAPVILGDGVKVGLITNILAHKARVREDVVERYAPKMVQVDTGQKDPASGDPILEPRLDREVVEERRMMLDIPVINPRHLYLDPLGRNLYRIQRVLRDRAFLSDRETRKLYRGSAVEAALADASGEREEDDAEQRDLQITGTRNAMRPQTEILEYWGPIYNKQGEMVERNKWVSLFNRKDVALYEPYPFWHGKDPFVVGNLLRVPFSPYGKLLIQHVGPIGAAITETLCMIGDAAKFGTLNGFAIDSTLLEDVAEIADGIFPGISLSVTGPNAIQELKFKGVDQGAIQYLGELLQMHQNYTGVTEFLSGSPSTRGRATATEVTSKTQQGAAFFESIAGDIEDFVFEPLLEKCYWNIIQFFDDWSQPMLAALAAKHGLTPDMLGASAVQRYQLLNGSFRFHAVGLSAVLRRAEMMEKLMRLLEILGNRPEFFQMIKADKLFEKVMEAFQFEDLINRANSLPPVIAQGAVAPQGWAPVQGVGNYSVPPPTAPNMGQASGKGQ